MMSIIFFGTILEWAMEETMTAVIGLLLDLGDGVHRDSFLLLYL